MTSVALTPDAFAARLSALSPPAYMALAVSGGRDSIALLRLCAGYAERTGAKLLALTVDHGLRAAAADEARFVSNICGSLGVAHETLRWCSAEPPKSGVQAAARQARYRLLIEAAQEAGCEALLTAHSEDDQAETVFMRLARGAGAKGLSAMREESLIAAGAGAPIRLLRPMLGFSREAITLFLESMGQDFADDPSNDDPAFERVRVRALLAAISEQEILTGPALAAVANGMAAADARLKQQERDLFDRWGGCFHGWGGVSLDRWREKAPGAGGLARRLIHAASAGDYAPNEEDALSATTQAAQRGAATLAGAMIRRWRERLWFLREPSALTGRAGVAPLGLTDFPAPLLWDRRFILGPGVSGCQVGPLGEKAAALLGPRISLFTGPPEGLAGLPALYREGVLISAPALPFMSSEAIDCRALASERFAGECVRF